MSTEAQPSAPLGTVQYSEPIGTSIVGKAVLAIVFSGAACVFALDNWAERVAQYTVVGVFASLATLVMYRLLTVSAFRVHENGISSVSLFGTKRMAFSEVARIYPARYSGSDLRTSADGANSVYNWQFSIVQFTSTDGLVMEWRWFEGELVSLGVPSTAMGVRNLIKSERTLWLTSIYSATAAVAEQHIDEQGFFCWGNRKKFTKRGLEIFDTQSECWVEIPSGNSVEPSHCLAEGHLALGQDVSGHAIYRESIDYETLFPGLLLCLRRDGVDGSEVLWHVSLYKENCTMHWIQKAIVGVIPIYESVLDHPNSSWVAGWLKKS